MNVPEIKIPDQRSRKFIFVPFCLVCQSFQAQGLVRYGWPAVIKPIVEEILKHDINIVQMPCPESQFGGLEKGLKRSPKSITEYDTEDFRRACRNLALETTKTIKAILANNYEVMAILGIEFSPSCSTKLQYSSKGTFHRPGLFVEALKKQLTEEKIEIPFIGINKRGIKKSLNDLKKLFNEQKELFI